MDLLTHPTVLTAVFVGAGVLILLYILKLIRKDEDVVVQKPKNETSSHSDKRKDTTHSGKSKKKVVESRWIGRNEKQAYSHPWLLTSLKGHTGSILDVDFSSNGKYLTSCGDEDPDPGGLASGESSSSSSSECNKENSRSPSVEPSPRAKKGLSRRQRKNRRKEAPSIDKQKKSVTVKSSQTSAKMDRNCLLPRYFYRFVGHPDLLWHFLEKYSLTPDQMLLNGYPVETSCSPGSVMIYKSPHMHVTNTKFDVNAREFVPRRKSRDSGQGSSSDSGSEVSNSDHESSARQQQHKSVKYERTCVRCYHVFKTTESKYISQSKCQFHWGKLKILHDERRYECCGGRSDAPGCSRASLHVWNGVVTGANGPFLDYMRTRPLRRDPNVPHVVFALDCEMCYTVRGLECTKVTVVDLDGCPVYDTYVKPEHKIVDYNTRFSGVTAKHLEKGAKPLRQVQRELLSIIGEDSILVGHGLDNDLRALRMVHGKVVDTAHSFPHRRGMPFRNSLKNLAASVLGREIQCGDNGHDSNEDAVAALDLILWLVCKNHREIRHCFTVDY